MISLGCTTKFPESEKFFFYITPIPKARLLVRQGSKKKNLLEVPLRGFRGKRGILSYTLSLSFVIKRENQFFRNSLTK